MMGPALIIVLLAIPLISCFLCTDLIYRKDYCRISSNKEIEGYFNLKNQKNFAQHAIEGPKEPDQINNDMIVVGSGIAGLTCASLLSSYGYKVTVCESHYHVGGAAHSFNIKGYTFDSGPSLFSGLSINPSPNPLKHVLNAIEEEVDWLTYDAWGVFLPQGYVCSPIGPKSIVDTLKKFGGSNSQKEWDSLMAYLLKLSKGAMGVPPFSFRQDIGVLLTLKDYYPAVLHALKLGAELQGPFSNILDNLEVNDSFIRQWLNLLCFLLQGLPADGTLTAVMAYMVADWYREGVVLDYPRGGSGSIVRALVRGIEKNGGSVMTNAHVEQILVEKRRACGVKLVDGRRIHCSKAVISNASIWDTLRLVPTGALPEDFVKNRSATRQCKSFMHAHLGIRAEDIEPGSLLCHYAHVSDWNIPIDSPGNVIIVSIPSVLDPTLSPPNCHAVHAYTAGNEPYSLWEGLDEKSYEYKRLKEERSSALLDAVEKVFPNLSSRLDVKLIGTPKTHERFLRRDRGTYGAEVFAGRDTFAGPSTPLKGLYCTGDSVWPGIGVPAVAASGSLVANSLTDVWTHLRALEKIKFGGV